MTMIKTIDVIPCSSTNPKAIRGAEAFPSRLKEVSGDTIRIREGATYQNCDQKVDVVCTKCSHPWEARPSSLVRIKASGCPECKRLNNINLTGIRRCKRADADTKQRAAELRASGMTYEAIAERLGFTSPTIQRWLKKEYRERQWVKQRELNQKSKASGHRKELSDAY